MATIVIISGDPPGNLGAVAEYFGVNVDQVSGSVGELWRAPGTLGNRGDNRGSVGIPEPAPQAEDEPAVFVVNVIREKIKELYGHPYFYFAALRYNNLDEAYVLRKNQHYLIPPRGNKAAMFEAASWRVDFGSP